ncbi:MAG: squalene/phytoene synthase family protein [Alphaproteobacteria bacterium]|nr:squalene/phytoene synthase family protein [Alphaproteobacteria bacterium]
MPEPDTPLARLRAQDYERYLTCLFAPPGRQEALAALYGFNYEIARVAEQVSEPAIGMIRLQWWRDAITEIYEGKPPRAHETVAALAAAVKTHRLPQEPFQRLINAREADLSDTPPQRVQDFTAYAEATGATLGALAAAILEASETATAAAREAAAAYAITGMLRATAFFARQRRLLLPYDLLMRHHVMANSIFDLKPSHGLAAAVRELAALAETRLERCEALAAGLANPEQRAVLAALLPAALARQHLKAIGRQRHNVFAPRLSMRHPLCLPRLAWRALRGF